ncbi:hypothetical protein, partial [Sansalvadorimonas verongulae]|uniref:hypothetical protein n=1 Tax=Sansalvadorimonas verongulae TaxID=2172824 RepID=UPI001E5D0775
MPTSQEGASYVVIFFVLFVGRDGMAFRLNFVVTTLCIVIGLSSSATYASAGKSRSLNIIRLQPLDVISTGSIAIYPAETIHIHPHKTTS